MFYLNYLKVCFKMITNQTLFREIPYSKNSQLVMSLENNIIYKSDENIHTLFISRLYPSYKTTRINTDYVNNFDFLDIYLRDTYFNQKIMGYTHFIKTKFYNVVKLSYQVYNINSRKFIKKIYIFKIHSSDIYDYFNDNLYKFNLIAYNYNIYDIVYVGGYANGNHHDLPVNMTKISIFTGNSFGRKPSISKNYKQINLGNHITSNNILETLETYITPSSNLNLEGDKLNINLYITEYIETTEKSNKVYTENYKYTYIVSDFNKSKMLSNLKGYMLDSINNPSMVKKNIFNPNYSWEEFNTLYKISSLFVNDTLHLKSNYNINKQNKKVPQVVMNMIYDSIKTEKSIIDIYFHKINNDELVTITYGSPYNIGRVTIKY